MTGHPFFDSGLLRGCGLGAFRAVILDFRPRLGNLCKVLPVFTLLRASIPKSWLEIKNRSTQEVVNGLILAAIAKFDP